MAASVQHSKKVTVVVVCYSHARYIAENLDSIKNQTYGNVELIIGDDASPDNSVEIIEKWIEKNNAEVKKNFHTKNTGLAEMLNECLEMATGEYVKLIAADDFLHPESIAKCVARLENAGNGCSFVHTDVRFIDDLGDFIENDFYARNVRIADEKIYENLLAVNSIAAPSVLVRTDYLKKTGRYNPAIICEDYDRWLRLLKISKCSYINEKLAYYRVLETSVTRQKTELIQREETKLRMQYDNLGTAKKIINRQIIPQLRKKPFDTELAKLYIAYPFSNKIISLLARLLIAVNR